MDYQPFATFQHWYMCNNETSYSVVEPASQAFVCNFNPETDKDVLPFADFEDFKQRPEYIVGRPVEVDGVDARAVFEQYLKLLEGIIRIRAYKAGKDPDFVDDYVQKVLGWVQETDFYEAPASTIYHESFPHGLLYHTMSVYNNMLELRKAKKFAQTDVASAALCCLTHDWCKIGLYESYKRNVKNEQTGQWEQKDAYRRGSFPHPLGHGAASMFMAMKTFNLTEEECAAIRWHMSMFNVSSNEVNEYQQACEDYPLVHLVQFSDQLAITNY